MQQIYREEKLTPEKTVRLFRDELRKIALLGSSGSIKKFASS